MNDISSWQQFVLNLESCSSIEQSQSVFAGSLLPSIDFSKYLHFSSGRYTRNLLYTSDKYELMLICWSDRQYTSIHDHASSDCIMACIEGVIEESIYLYTPAGLAYEKSRLLKPFEPVMINNTIGVHQIKNIQQGNSISLHYYAPPITSFKSYPNLIDDPVEVESQFFTDLT